MVPSTKLILATAEELHKTYRAATKSRTVARTDSAPSELRIRNDHDHGWAHCPRKAYFMRRAVLFLKDLNYRMTAVVPF